MLQAAPIFTRNDYRDVLRREMDSVANNLANANTTGYKSQTPLFKEVLSRVSPTETVSMVIDQGSMTNTSDGPHRTTENNFDFGLRGSPSTR